MADGGRRRLFPDSRQRPGQGFNLGSGSPSSSGSSHSHTRQDTPWPATPVGSGLDFHPSQLGRHQGAIPRRASRLSVASPGLQYAPPAQDNQAIYIPPQALAPIRQLSTRPTSYPGTPGLPSMPINRLNRDNNLRDYNLLSELGSGSYGSVWLAEAKYDTSRRVAIKKIVAEGEDPLENMARERAAGLTLRHPNVVMMFDSFFSHDRRHAYFIMEFVLNGNFQTIILEHGGLRPATVRYYMAELLMALEYLRQHSWVHRDLKPENLMLDSRLHLKVCDFGLAKTILPEGQRPRSSSCVGTYGYMAPETAGYDTATYAVDIWSFACILFAFQCGKAPHKYDTNEKNARDCWYERMMNEEVRNWRNNPSQEMLDLFSATTRLEPEDRLGYRSYYEIRSHPFFSKIDWNLLPNREPPPMPFKKENDVPPILRDVPYLPPFHADNLLLALQAATITHGVTPRRAPPPTSPRSSPRPVKLPNDGAVGPAGLVVPLTHAAQPMFPPQGLSHPITPPFTPANPQLDVIANIQSPERATPAVFGQSDGPVVSGDGQPIHGATVAGREINFVQECPTRDCLDLGAHVRQSQGASPSAAIFWPPTPRQATEWNTRTAGTPPTSRRELSSTSTTQANADQIFNVVDPNDNNPLPPVVSSCFRRCMPKKKNKSN